MDLEGFVNSRRHRWERTNTLLEKVEASGPDILSVPEADELFSLYRLLSSDLNLIQTRAGNPAILEYLESLVGRAYSILSVNRSPSVWRRWWQIMRHEFPAEIRRHYRMVLLSALTMVAGMLLGYLSTRADTRVAELFLPAEHLSETPAQRVVRLEEEELDSSGVVAGRSNIFVLFSTFLFTHNIRVSIFCFALGFTFGIGTLAVLFFNGAMVGSLAAMYHMDNVLVFFVAWVGPHGSIELPCVVFAGAAGLIIAKAQLRRDQGSLRDQLTQLRPQLIRLLAGTATLLVFAGLIEGGFSQINEPTLPYSLKIIVAGGLFVMLLFYLGNLRVKEIDKQEDGLTSDIIKVAAT
ncbi:MAG: membrane protein [Phycisphaerae bacterium]|nr:MAG: membrane protein [Phycisphaerae bacterium]